MAGADFCTLPCVPLHPLFTTPFLPALIMTTLTHPIPPAPTRPSRIPVLKLFSRTSRSAAAPGVPDLHFSEAAGFDRFRLMFLRRLGATTLACPVALRGQKPDTIPPLQLIGEALGLGDECSQRLLRHHHEQRLRRQNMGTLVHWTLATPVLYLGALGYFAVSEQPWRVFWPAAAGVYLTAFLAGGIITRIRQLLVDRHFAESLSATHAMYLLADLHREDVLARADRRRELVSRFDGLSRAVRLLALRYGSNEPGMRMTVQRHFREISRYITERRMWAVTPVETTLEDLRRDVRELVRIFTMGTYGEFRWAAEPADPPPPAGGWKPLLRGIGKTVGLLAPPAAMVYLLQHPQQLQALGSSSEMIGVMLGAWVLLALDSVLQLGVISGLVGLAKSIKELK
jgi:hypothetical protein